MDHKNGSAGELRQYLSHVAEVAASASSLSSDGTTAGSLPEVIILDDLHNAGAGALADAFGGLLAVSGGMFKNYTFMNILFNVRYYYSKDKINLLEGTMCYYNLNYCVVILRQLE